MDDTENSIDVSQVKGEVSESGLYSEGDVEKNETVCEASDTVIPEADVSDVGIDRLAELCRVSGKSYNSIEEFPEHERFIQLMDSGILTAEEAFYAVNRGKSVPKSVVVDSKKHMVSAVRKPSSGEVFTRADREELAKWGISATGSELERLWREASGG